MKAYRGMVLGCVALLMAVSLSSCGDADDWRKTLEIKLEAKQGTGLNDVVFTVRSTPPAASDALNACETVLEYRAEGAGVDIRWHSIFGNETTRVFSVKPRRAGEMTVVARGKCAGSKEDWKYSNIVNVSVTEVVVPPPVLPTPTSVTLTPITASPYDREGGAAPDVTFTLSAVAPAGCTLALTYQYSGAGYGLNVFSSGAAAPGTKIIPTPSAVGTLTIAASGWCTENPSAIMSATTIIITVTDPP